MRASADRREAAPLGILAGGSGVPCEIAEAVTQRGRSVHIVGLEGEAETDIARFPHTWVNWGKFGAMVRAFRSNGCREIVIVGRVRRPNLMGVRADLGFWTSLPQLLPIIRGGDDTILRLVIRLFERHGLTVVGAQDAAPELLAPAGQLGAVAAAPADMSAISLCAAALAALGPFDAAQAAIGRSGQLIAVEAADGTDAMLRRLTTTAAQGAVLVKLPKSHQERRIDLPAIGPETVRRAVEVGLSGIAVLRDGTLIAERQTAIREADAAGLFIVGVEGTADPVTQRPAEAVSHAIAALKPCARTKPGPSSHRDVGLGARVISALDPFWQRASVVVSRGYVLATDGPGGALQLAERAGRLKPWGLKLLRRRVGVLVMTDIVDEVGHDPGEIIERARSSGLAGVAVLRSPCDRSAVAALCASADRAGLFVLAPGDLP